jgi:hypothetical protein
MSLYEFMNKHVDNSVNKKRLRGCHEDEFRRGTAQSR